MRRRVVAGNWKMYGTTAESTLLAGEIAGLVRHIATAVDIVLAPAFPSLAAVRSAVAGTGLEVAAQDLYWAEEGAFTGAVSPSMVAEHATRVIVGHSERRRLFGETDDNVQRKIHAAFDHGLVPILCVGETGAERDAGRTDEVVRHQLAAATEGLRGTEAGRLVVAYEPVWAIGTGRACEPAEADRVARHIRNHLSSTFGSEAAGRARVVYGGSVQPRNVEAFLASPDVDGALVGGASLNAESFAALVKAAAAASFAARRDAGPLA